MMEFFRYPSFLENRTKVQKDEVFGLESICLESMKRELDLKQCELTGGSCRLKDNSEGESSHWILLYSFEF